MPLTEHASGATKVHYTVPIADVSPRRGQSSAVVASKDASAARAKVELVSITQAYVRLLVDQVIVEGEQVRIRGS